MLKIDRLKMGTQMALKAQCSTQPLRGKVSAWAISVIMAAHALGGLDKQWLWWHMVSHVCSRAKTPHNSFNQMIGRIQRVSLDQTNHKGANQVL